MSGAGPKSGRPEAIRIALEGIRSHLGYVALFSAVANILLLGPSLYSLQVYDRVISSRSPLTLVFVTIVLVVVLSAFALFDNLRLRLLARAGLKLDRELADGVLLQTLAAPASDPARRQGLRDLDRVRGALSGQPALALIDAPWSLLFIGFCFLIHPAIGLLVVVGAAILLGLAVLNERTLGAATERSSDVLSRTYASAEAASANSETVMALGMRRNVVRRIIVSRLDALAVQLHLSFSAGFFQSLIRGVRMALQSAALGVGAALVIDGKMSAGGIFAASLLTSRALGPAETVVASWKTLLSSFSAWRRLNDLVRKAGEAPPPAIALPAPSGRLQLENVVVRTGPDSFALRNVNLEVKPGEMLGVIGPSGAGKSTLTRVAVGALAPEGGRVRYDGADAGQWDRDRLGRYIGWLPQDIGLMGGTISENISRFEPRLPETEDDIDAAVIRAAQAAGAHEMILQLPKGYQTLLGPSGRGLSGGQGQRVALARAVYREPPLCVFDEPDAHVDGEGEQALMALLSTLKTRGTTVLLVGHRPPLMQFVDRLAILQAGSIVSIKNRDEVLPAPARVAGSQP